MTIWVVPTADRGCGTGGHIARPYGRGDGGTVGAACMAARGGLAVSASLRWNEVRHGRAYSPPLRWGTFGGSASDAAVRRGRLIAAPTGLRSGYSLGQGLSLADGFGGQFASAKRLALHTKRPAYAGSAGGVRSTPYSLLLYSTAIWARYSYSMVAGGLLVMS